ncbi:MAG: hypothetical protein QXJ17_05585 [Nitrososphaeria archaeon]
MSQKTKLPYGPVKLSVDAIGFEDGRIVQFEIYRKKGGKEELVSQVNGAVVDQKAEAKWVPEAEERRITLGGDSTEAGDVPEDEEYYFKARIDELEVSSEKFEFTYPLEIYLKDDRGRPLDGLKFEIEFSDGSKREGVIKDGYAKVKDAPKGRFKVKVKGYKFKEG